MANNKSYMKRPLATNRKQGRGLTKTFAFGGFEFDTPQEAIVQQQANVAKAQLDAMNSVQGLKTVAGIAQMAGNMMQSYGMSQMSDGAAKDKLKNNLNISNQVSSQIPAAFQQFGTYALGGNVPVEVEGNEMGQMPNGMMLDFQGPSHEQGGIPVNLPQGTKIYSDRVSVDGKTMAQRKKYRENKIDKLQKKIDKGDRVAKNTLDRYLLTAGKEEQLDMSIQQMLNEADNQYENGGIITVNGKKYRNGRELKEYGDNGKKYMQAPNYEDKRYSRSSGAVGFRPPILDMYVPVGKKNIVNNYPLYNPADTQGFNIMDNINALQNSSADNTAQLTPQQVNVNPVGVKPQNYNKVPVGKRNKTANTPVTQGKPVISFNPDVGDTYTPFEKQDPVYYKSYSGNPDNNSNIPVNQQETNNSVPGGNSSEYASNSIFDALSQMPTIGDALGIYGNLHSAYAGKKNTLANRAGDTGNINMYRNYGLEGLKTLNESKRFAKQMGDIQRSEVELARKTATDQNRKSARGINTMRALDLASQANANRLDMQIYQNEAAQLQNILGMEAQMKNQRDQMVMQGEQARDLADRQDRDQFYTNMIRDEQSIGQGLANTGLALNKIKERNASINAINNIYGNFKTNANGDLIGKKGEVIVGKKSMEEEVKDFDGTSLGYSKAEWDKMTLPQKYNAKKLGFKI